jgi:lipoprotein-anchoring transpeptidase ErfK/SrfK
MRRFIYIHGTPDSVPIGVPGSKGCVRMRNRDIIDLYDRVPAGTVVEIVGPAQREPDEPAVTAEKAVGR